MSRSVFGRLEREALRRRMARDCPPHPEAGRFWLRGDYATPDRLVCGRCFAQLAAEPHRSERHR